MQNPSVMALYMPVASRLSSRTGLSLPRLLLPIAAAIVLGGGLTMVGNSPLILLNDLLMAANSNLPSGAATRAACSAAADRATLAASRAYLPFGDKQLRDDDCRASAWRAIQSYFANAYGIDGDTTNWVTATACWSHVAAREALHGARRAAGKLATSRGWRHRPMRDLGMLGAMGLKQQVADSHNFALSLRLRTFGDLFNPSRAGISEVAAGDPKFIGKTA
jgi:hypothetical protein